MARNILFLLTASVAVVVLAGATSPGTARAGGGCHGAEPARLTDEATNQVLASDCAFMPTVVRVDVGAPVTWTNNDKIPHTFTGVAGSFGDYKEHVAGQSVSYSFEKSGVYPYFCELHPGMVGAVIVGDVSTSAAGALDAARLVSVQAPGAGAGGTQPSASEASDGGVSTTALALVVGAVVLVTGAGLGVAVMRRRGMPS